MPAPIKVGDVVKVTFINKATNQPSAVVGVVEMVDAAQVATVFIGNRESWSVPTSSVTPLRLPSSFSWSAEDTQTVRSTATAFLSTAVSKAAAPATSPNRYQAELEASLIGSFKEDPATAHHGASNGHVTRSFSFRGHDNYSFEPNASHTNVLYEINARLTGLCNWTSPPLTALFLMVLYMWIAMEGSSILLPSTSTPQLLDAVFVAQRSAVAVVRTLLAVTLCTCLSMAPRQTPSSTFWLLFMLVVVSFGGLMPLQWWDALVISAFPIPLRSSDHKSTTIRGSAPAILWVCKAALVGVRCVLCALSKAMIATGESLRAVSEGKN